MTKEEILAMESGEDLDRLVAVEVMDLFCVYEPPYLGWANREYWYDMDVIPTNVRSYSTDILSAWQVAKMMVAEYGDFVIDYDDSYNGGGWSASVDKLRVAALAKTAPEAICKAALLAKLKTL